MAKANLQKQVAAIEAAATEYGDNVKAAIIGTKVVLVIEGAHDGGVNNSGKTNRVASTLGNPKVEGLDHPSGKPVFLGVNAYFKAGA